MILDGPIDSVVPVDVADAVIATLREALSNVARHAGATLVDVELAVGSEVLLRVCDNGRGMTAPAPAGGHGLANMAMPCPASRRAVRCRPRPVKGTVVTWKVPLS